MVAVVFILVTVWLMDWLNQRFTHLLARAAVLLLIPYHATLLFHEVYGTKQAGYNPDPLEPVGLWMIMGIITVISIGVLLSRIYMAVEEERLKQKEQVIENIGR